MAIEEMITSLPSVSAATMQDIIYAVQGYVSPTQLGTSVQETLQQIYNLFQANVVLFNAGNPNGVVAGVTYQFCWDTTDKILWICTTSGTASTAVWTQSIAGNINTGTANQIAYYATSGTTLSGLTGANSAMLVTNSTGVPSMTASMTNGQVIIGSTGSTPAPATLTAGTNISITNGAHSVTINASGMASITWTDVTGISQTMAANAGYVADNSSLVTLTLPTTAAFGTIIYVQGLGSGGWTIAQNSGQNVQVGSVSTTVGTGGSISSANRYDSIALVCIVANTTWGALGAPQSTGLSIV